MKRCSKCKELLKRVYYKIPDIPGSFCRKCIHEIYRVYGITFYAKDGEEDDEPQVPDLPVSLKAGSSLKLEELIPSQHFTKPPARYTEASLVRQLEAEGIGRPSTYAQIINTIQTREYVERIDEKTYLFVSKSDETTYIQNARNLKEHIKNLAHYEELDNLSHKEILWDSKVLDTIKGVIE